MHKLNKFLKPISLALVISCMASSNVWAAGEEARVGALAAQLAPILKIIRSLAFLGCVVILIVEAWNLIKSGKLDWEGEGKKLLAMAVGFVILFAVGAIISAFLPASSPIVTPFNG